MRQGDSTRQARKELLERQRTQLKERLKDIQESLELLDYKISPVSYTHLDVYKRQGLWHLRRMDWHWQRPSRQLSGVENFGEAHQGHDPAAEGFHYAGLFRGQVFEKKQDVYKRQP